MTTGHSAQPSTPATALNYYQLLGTDPSASPQVIRQTYRDLSKLYHPDTTTLPAAIATAKFQDLNEAYATLSNPDRRLAYDLKMGYARVSVIQPQPSLSQAASFRKSSAYLDPTDRPLSAGELFALLILTVTFIGCVLLAIAVGLTRGEVTLQTPVPAVQVSSPAANPRSSASPTAEQI
ncbi:MAG: J domain-containing protein [Leptolyngbya sp. DLM2.Bin15]|nr:MAG: J domain-containing protein [Leptolyngbya sp. DLM2.Bin15]